MLGYIMALIRDNKDFKEAIRNINYGQKEPKWQTGSFQVRRQSQRAKRMIFKGDQSFNTVFGLWERLNLFRTSYMSGFHMKPIRDNEVLKEAFRNINIYQMAIWEFSKETTVLTHFLMQCEKLKVLWTCDMSGYLWSRKEGQKQPKTTKIMIFKGDRRLNALFFKAIELLTF